jgi:hypothetical protein
MSAMFKYEFVRLKGSERNEYQTLVNQYAEQGWRLVQVLAPGSGGLWASANFFELIFEREIDD